MADPLFRNYIVHQAETLRNELSDPNMSVEGILERAKQILKLENRLKRIDNPTSRKKKEPTPE